MKWYYNVMKILKIYREKYFFRISLLVKIVEFMCKDIINGIEKHISALTSAYF